MVGRLARQLVRKRVAPVEGMLQVADEVVELFVDGFLRGKVALVPLNRTKMGQQ